MIPTARSARGRAISSTCSIIRATSCARMLDAAKAMKAKRVKGAKPTYRPLAGKTLALIFDRPSTRTRVSFDLAMRELGGETIMLTGAEMQLGRGETIADTARVLSRYVDAIMIRILEPRRSRRAGAPCDGAGDQRPDQAVASLPGDGRPDDLRGASRPDRGPQGRLERRLQQRAVVVDRAAERFGFQLDIACPKELQPPPERIAWAKPAAPTWSCATIRSPRSPARRR